MGSPLFDPVVESSPLAVVIVHCLEPLAPVVRQLRAARVPFVVYHKTSRRCREPQQADVAPGELITMPHNLGRECAGYLRFIVDRYERGLPQMTVFLQAGAEMHMPFSHGLWHNLRPLLNTSRGFVALSKNAFEGQWPTPCEPARTRAAFGACQAHYWREASDGGPEAGRPPPSTFRFYANGLFAVSATRIRRRPLSLYEELLSRLEGRAPLRCVNPKDRRQGSYAAWANETDRIAPAEIDCLMLEKLWHVMMGEPSTMPPPADYDASGGRYTADDVAWSNARGGKLRAGRIVCEEPKMAPRGGGARAGARQGS